MGRGEGWVKVGGGDRKTDRTAATVVSSKGGPFGGSKKEARQRHARREPTTRDQEFIFPLSHTTYAWIEPLQSARAGVHMEGGCATIKLSPWSSVLDHIGHQGRRRGGWFQAHVAVCLLGPDWRSNDGKRGLQGKGSERCPGQVEGGVERETT